MSVADNVKEFNQLSEEIAHTGSPAPLFGVEAPSLTVSRPAVSVVAPMFNEAGGAGELVQEIAAALAGRDFEIIVVDDCSTDETVANLEAIWDSVPALRIVRHAANAGQSRAVRTGVIAARSAIVATLDGDGQNDPADLPQLIDALASSGDPLLAMVAGERRVRKDNWRKRYASKAANALRSRLLKDGAADTGCGLKAFKRDAYLRAPFFDHQHRYLPSLFKREGYNVSFRPVGHRPRRHGTSKYTNLGRLAVAFRDMAGVVWLIQRARSPVAILEVRRDAECVTKSDGC